MFFSDSTDSNLGDSYCGRTLPAVKGQIMANTIDFLQQLLEISCYGDTPHGTGKTPVFDQNTGSAERKIAGDRICCMCSHNVCHIDPSLDLSN